MLDRRPAGPARRIAAENAFGDEGGGGEAGGKDALVEFRPQLFRRAIGDGRFALLVVLLRHTPSQAGDRDACHRLVCSSPSPLRRRHAPPGVQGACRPPWSMGVRRESRHLPPVEAGAETPVVVQDAKVLVAGCKGVRPPPARWVQGEPKSPWSRCNGDHVASAGTGSMPVSASARLINPLARRSSKERLSPRDCPGGSAGDGQSPRKVRAVLPRTPCTF